MLDLSTAVLCDFAQVRDRLLFVASGAVSRLYRRELPSPLGLMVGLVIEVPLEDAGMEHGLRAEVINRHGTVLATLQNTFRVSDEGLFPHEVQQVPLVLSITGVRARTWGTHQVRLYLDDELVRALTLYVVPAAGTQVVQAPSTPAQAGADADAPEEEPPPSEEASADGEEAPAAEGDAPEDDAPAPASDPEPEPAADPEPEADPEGAPVIALVADEPQSEPGGELDPAPEWVREPAFGAEPEAEPEPEPEAEPEADPAPLFPASQPETAADPPMAAPTGPTIAAERAVPSFDPVRFEEPPEERAPAPDELFDFDADDVIADPPGVSSSAEAAADAEEKSRFAFRYRYDE